MDIMANGETGTNFGWRCIIHYGENQTYKPLKMIAINNTRDYARSFTDVTTITCVMPLGKYARRIYAFRDQLQITLQKLPQREQREIGDGDAEIQSERFSASLIDEDRSPQFGQGTEVNDEEAMDVTGIVNVSFQLFNKSLEQVRMMSVGGVFRRTRVEQLIRTMLTNEAQKADVDDERAILGIDMVPASNQDTQEQVVITHGTKLVDVPDFVHKRYGVYNAGLGSYIQNKYWHLFPLYDTTRFEERQQTLTIIVLPKSKFMNIDRTYRLVGDSLTVLMSSETGFKDDSGTDYLKDGNGARFSDAGRIMDDVATNQGNKAIISRKRNANEFTADKRPDGVQHVPMAQNRISSNPFTVYSEISARRGGLFKGVWQNSDPKLILPGMACRIIYSDRGETKELYGVIHGGEHVSKSIGDITSDKFMTTSILYAFVANAPVGGDDNT